MRTSSSRKITEIHAESDGAYGSPRVTAELRDADGIDVNEKKIARVMRKFRIVGTHLRKKVRTTIPDPVGHRGAGPVQTGLHRARTEPEVHGRHHISPGR